MLRPLSHKYLPLFLIGIVCILLGIIAYQRTQIVHSLGKFGAQVLNCQNELDYKHVDLQSCNIQLGKRYQPYSACDTEKCLYVSETDVRGFFTFIGDTRTETSEFMGQPVECTYVTISSTSVNAEYLLREKFGEEQTFSILNARPGTRRTARAQTFIADFPSLPNFGPLPCEHPPITLIY